MQLGLTAAQLEERKSGIYGTDAKMIVEGEWRKLWRIKKGLDQPEDLSDILRVQLGSFTEEFNLFWYTKQTGREVTNRNESKFCNPKLVGFPMRANLDGLTTTSKGRPAYIDAKHVGRADEATVLRYTPQLTHCALVCGVEWWCISFLIGNSKWELIEQEVDPFFAEELLAKESDFWGYMERNEEPPDMTAPVAAPKPQAALRKVDLSDANQSRWPNWGGGMVDYFGKLAANWSAWTACNIARDEIKELLPLDVGEVTRGNIKVARTKAGAVTINIKKEK